MITPAQRDWAMEAHARTGSTLSVILVSSGLVGRTDLYEVIAEMTGVPFCDLNQNPPDPDLLAGWIRGGLPGTAGWGLREGRAGRGRTVLPLQRRGQLR
jgi:hypothetical protein